MRERPILFSGPEVRAILAGHKTQTRRVVKPQPNSGPAAEMVDLGCGGWGLLDGDLSGEWRCPFGVPGDRLWVRETYALESSCEVGWYEPPFSDGRPLRVVDDPELGRWWEQPHYRATDPTPELEIGAGDPGVRWRPSIHMPRWASRITLEVTEVRVQRLQEISEEDALAEGVRASEADVVICDSSRIRSMENTARGAFACLWDAINAKRGYGWDADPWVWAGDANPWVWAVTFQRMEVPQP